MPMESHEQDHKDARETRRWVLEMRAQILFVKWAASVGAVGLIARWVS